MEKVNLFWAIIWGIVCLCAIIGFWWNPIHYFTAIFSAFFCGMFCHDYIKEKRMK